MTINCFFRSLNAVFQRTGHPNVTPTGADFSGDASALRCLQRMTRSFVVSHDDERSSNPATWQGQNLLGFTLIGVREN